MAAPGALASHDSIVIDDDSTASELDLDLDLEPFKPPASKSGVKRRRQSGEASPREEAEQGRDRDSGEDVDGKVEWTDDSDGAYERLKKRKRGTGRGSGRGRGRGRGGGAADRKKRSGENKGKQKAAIPTVASSSRRSRAGRRPMKKTGAINDDSDSTTSDDALAGSDDDENPDMPDYLKQRRREFQDKLAVLQDAGLRLPPDYTDIYFSDDDDDVHRHRQQQASTPAIPGVSSSSSSNHRARDNGSGPQPLQERPQFDASVRPSREKKDIVLQYSAGVIPASIAQYLRDYQVAGVQFLHRLFVYQQGGILGDDMGLGKTVQVAAFLTAAFGKTGDERDAKRMRKMRRAEPVGEGDDQDGRWYPVVLVICPGSLIQNWRSELQRWGWWHVDLYHGAEKDDVLQAARAGRLEIMVTTYATYKNHREKINAVRWDAVVADECHVLKERASETTRAMNEVNALCRIGLTGTAIQNRYEELWTLLNWTNPGHFGTIAEWRQTISRPLTIGQSHDATLYQLSLARRTAKKLVQNLLPGFFLRRMKSLIAHQLPRKTDRVVFCPLTERQSRAYENFIESEQVEFLRSVSEPCACGSGKKRGWCCHRYLSDGKTTWFSLVFPTIQSLLKLANHLTLLIPSADNAIAVSTNDPDAPPPMGAARAANERYERAMNVLKLCVPDDWEALYRHRDSLVNLANPEFCGKWKVLRKLLRFWHEHGDKVLVFSHNVRLLRILRHLFHNTSYSVSYLDGTLTYDDRQKVVDDFNTDPAQFVFLISTKAGGVGLNITSANKVVIFDPHWNPAYDLQAQDRAYRIGQVRDVDVFRLVSAGTIEEIVYARQIYKQQQANIGYSASTERRYFRGVQQDSARKGEIFGLNNLFTFHADQVVLRDIVNKTNIAEAKAGVRLTSIDMERAAADDDNDVLVKIEGAATAAGGGGGGGGSEAALSQLAAELEEDEEGKKGETAAAPAPAPAPAAAASNKPKSDAVQAILASAGVEYTHENSEVVGSSRVEAQLSRRAELVLAEEDDRVEDAHGDLDGDAQPALNGRQDTSADMSALLADTSAAFVSAAGHMAAEDGDGDGDGDAGLLRLLPPGFRFRYNPPADVRRRQFCTMARDAGFARATDFALVVEGWTPEKRRQCLEGFYRKRAARVRERLEAERQTESEAEGEGGEDDQRDDEAQKKDEEIEMGTEGGEKRNTTTVKMERVDGKEEEEKKRVSPQVKKEEESEVSCREPSLPRMIKKEASVEDEDRHEMQAVPSVRIKREPDDEHVVRLSDTDGTTAADEMGDDDDDDNVKKEPEDVQASIEVTGVRIKREPAVDQRMVILQSSPVLARVKAEPKEEGGGGGGDDVEMASLPLVHTVIGDSGDDEETDETDEL